MWRGPRNLNYCGIKINKWLEAENYTDQVKIYQSKIADELNKMDDYDAVVSTTIVPDSVKDKVINGLGLLTGIGADKIFEDVKHDWN